MNRQLRREKRYFVNNVYNWDGGAADRVWWSGGRNTSTIISYTSLEKAEPEDLEVGFLITGFKVAESIKQLYSGSTPGVDEI